MAPAETKTLRLWLPTVAPTIWAAHFMIVYVTGAIICEKAATGTDALDPARLVVAVATVAALTGIAATALRAWRHARFKSPYGLPHDEASSEDRQRFIAHVTLLLCGLSAIATVFAAMPAVVFRSCI